MSTTDTHVSHLIINTLSKAKYKELVNNNTVSSTELYLTTDEDYYLTFEVTYGTTTYAQITAALADHQEPVCYYNGNKYTYAGLDTYYYLTCVIGDTVKYIRVSSSNVWSNDSYTVQHSISDLNTIRSNASQGASASNTISGYGDIVSHNASEFATKATTLSGYGITDAYTKTQVDGIVSSVYKPAGSVAFASLPTLSSSVLGNVYNVTDAFTTNSNFVEGSGKSYPAGTNVVVVEPTSGTYKFDVLAGFVDLSGYVPTTRTVNNKALSADITLSASDVGAVSTTDGVTAVAAGTTADKINVTKNGSTSTITVNNVAAATKATQDGDGNTISSTYVKTNTKGAANGVASLDANTKIPEAQIPNKYIKNGDILLDLSPLSKDVPRRILQEKLDDCLYCADKRFTVTLTGFTNYPQRFFDGQGETYNSLVAGQIGTVLIEGTYNFGIGYPYGYIYCTFYHGNGPRDVSNVTCRVYQNWTGHNVGWVTLTGAETANEICNDGVKSITTLRFRNANVYGIEKIELTFDNTDGTSTTETTDLRVCSISLFADRTGVHSLPVLTKWGGDTVYGNLTIPTANGSFIGNLTGDVTGTADKATKDASGNTITSTYLKLAGGTMTGAIKFATGSLTQNQTPQYYLAMDAFADGGEVKWTSVANTRAGKDVDGNAIKTTYAKTSSLATVATSGSYNDLTNKPTIPTVNNATLTIQANGTQKGTFTANSSTNTTINIQKSDFVTSKTFTGLIATEANEKNSTVYLATINPTSWNAEWSVRYRLEVTLDEGATPSNYQYYNSQHECYLTGRQGVYTAYANFNSISSTDYRPIYYIKNQRTTEAGYNAGYGHKIGVEFQSSSNPTNTSYKRTIKVTILDAINCTAVLNDAPEVPVNSTRTDYTKLSSSYYSTSESNTAGNWVRFNGYTNGLQETGDANDNTYNQVMMSNNYLSNGSYNDTTALYIFNYNIIGFDKNGAALCISVPSTSATTASTALSTTRVYTTVGFDYVKGLMYTAQNTAYAGGADVNIAPRLCYSGVDLRYSDNCLAASSANTMGLVNRKPIYLRGTIGNDGLFYLAPLEVTYNSTTYKRAWTQDLPSVEDNYVYWFIGYPYYNSSYPNSLYQVDFNPSRNVLEYKNGKYQPYTPPASVTVDGTTIVNNGSGVLSAQAVKNQNDTTTAVKTWVGTQDEYNALSSYDANTIYNIVDSEDSVSNIYQQPLLTSIWSDHKLNDPSWLRADTFSWQSGDIYKAVYNHLLQDITNNTLSTLYAWTQTASPYNIYYTATETPTTSDYLCFKTVFVTDDVIGYVSQVKAASLSGSTLTDSNGATYTRQSSFDITGDYVLLNTDESYTAPDGHKIFASLADSAAYNIYNLENTAINYYNNTGAAWYFILDTENQRFKLPRTKYGFTGLRTNVGDYVSQEVLLPNITGTIPLGRSNSSLVTGSFYTASASDTLSNSGGSSDTYLGVLSASRSSSVYSGNGTNTKIQPAATQMYLYFYVGSYAKPAIVQTAGINLESFNTKVDLDASNLNNTGKSNIVNLMMPSSTYTNLTLGASGASYIAPANGWIILHATQTATNGYAFLRNATGSELVSSQQPSQVNNFEIRLFIPIAKGQTAIVDYSGINVTVFRFVYAIGSIL